MTVPPGICDSTIVGFSMEFRLAHGSMELYAHRKSQKSRLFMALGKFPFSERRISIWAQNFHFLRAEFPFSESRIFQGGLVRSLLQFLSAKFAFPEHRISIFEHRISIFSLEFTFSECRMLDGLVRSPLSFLSAKLASSRWTRRDLFAPQQHVV